MLFATYRLTNSVRARSFTIFHTKRKTCMQSWTIVAIPACLCKSKQPNDACRKLHILNFLLQIGPKTSATRRYQRVSPPSHIDCIIASRLTRLFYKSFQLWSVQKRLKSAAAASSFWRKEGWYSTVLECKDLHSNICWFCMFLIILKMRSGLQRNI